MLAPEHLVPRSRRERRQPGRGGRASPRRRSATRASSSRCGPGRRAPSASARVVVDEQHVGRGGAQALDDRGERARRQPVGRVDEPDVVAARELEPEVARRARGRRARQVARRARARRAPRARRAAPARGRATRRRRRPARRRRRAEQRLRARLRARPARRGRRGRSSAGACGARCDIACQATRDAQRAPSRAALRRPHRCCAAIAGSGRVGGAREHARLVPRRGRRGARLGRGRRAPRRPTACSSRATTPCCRRPLRRRADRRARPTSSA